MYLDELSNRMPYTIDVENKGDANQSVSLFDLGAIKSGLPPDLSITCPIAGITYGDIRYEFANNKTIFNIVLFEILSDSDDELVVGSYLHGVIHGTNGNVTVNTPFDTVPLNNRLRLCKKEFTIDRYSTFNFSLPAKSKVRIKFYPALKSAK